MINELNKIGSYGGKRSRDGYSLLEVLLALALSVAVYAAIAMGIQTHLVGLTRQKVMLERKQIARSILDIMAKDLRAGIQYKAADYSGLENLVQTQQLMTSSVMSLTDAATAGASAAELTDMALAPGGAASLGDATQSSSTPSNSTLGSSSPTTGSTSSSSTEDEDSPILDEDEVSFRPSLIGSQQIVTLDISRLPRLDQYNPLIASADALMQSPSDVKSISYYFSDSSGGQESQIQYDTGAPGGLYRREIDRAVAAYMGISDPTTSPDAYTKLVASEVAEVRFRYFDGAEWQSTWDSADAGTFPPAIEITLVIDPARSSTNNTTYSYGGFDRTTMESFRAVVHLPVAEVVEAE